MFCLLLNITPLILPHHNFAKTRELWNSLGEMVFCRCFLLYLFGWQLCFNYSFHSLHLFCGCCFQLFFVCFWISIMWAYILWYQHKIEKIQKDLEWKENLPLPTICQCSSCDVLDLTLHRLPFAGTKTFMLKASGNVGSWKLSPVSFSHGLVLS